VSDYYERTIQSTHLKSLQQNAAQFKTLCLLIAMLTIGIACVGAIIAFANSGMAMALLAIPVLLQAFALIYFAQMMNSLSAVTAATFELVMASKQAQQKTRDDA